MFRGRGFIAWFYAVSLCCGFLSSSVACGGIVLVGVVEKYSD